MTDFDSALKKVAEVIQTAARKSGEIIENTKISYNISTERDKITRLQMSIGAKFYNLFNEGGVVPDFILGELKEIAAIEDNIRVLEKNISDTKAYKFCPECGAKLNVSDVYCAKCGASQRQDREAPKCSSDAQDTSYEKNDSVEVDPSTENSTGVEE